VGELRKDYILDRYVIIATERAKRPDQFKSETKPKKEEVCYFCPSNEHMTPAEICRFPEYSNDWQIRVFPNKFPAVRAEGNPNIRTDNLFYTYSDAYGYHEVIVETPNHDETLADLNEVQISEVLFMFNSRIEENLKNPNVKYVTVFKNHGEKAGTSIVHTHCQLITSNKVPETILEKEKAVKKYPSCPYCSVIEREKSSYRRCFEDSSFVSFTPYASRFPFEIWLLPKRHILKMSEFTKTEYMDLAVMLKKILLKLKSLNADYNFYIQYGIENMHLHIEICPRLASWAGFELATGTIINSMTPEAAAEYYRG
jgi:UDPglucose--hexose-1-phosphate uridylyltransferase